MRDDATVSVDEIRCPVRRFPGEPAPPQAFALVGGAGRSRPDNARQHGLRRNPTVALAATPGSAP